ncbi:Ferric/cupric reductase transmembrane component 2 [Fulvia fulva]|uniref:ferric-chelate reductase (NADPH) n=1 Tax=Passalora fulva TaxID=5499 RepID=A0A9Q8L653_PASFU|nr:Ferric/cupric reductase transmembrane component 2 [Fulvia fulva]KAK4634742.1 Ferric/cupric reductase transmembrane component 2 [Fulvia fulva]KAK4637149.1 Ferric/cupric reductase transmembrane component 2 [Fulvia fulva]UJO11557.1 Ferric/cupric reductase transmembrane component 2 [Fulvia fulva]WPV10178.1 Ferric/cupric reductase transmembrane component 2 [Fulvia fulva]WPV24400.1 Ferric/cupric reductase transmembrane component 2 [Fulvia fulva]
MDSIVARHIQDHGEANTTAVKYWGYAERILPCRKDAGTCEYLEAVYTMHDTSMLYSFILWGVILGILALWTALRIRSIGVASQGRGGLVDDMCSQVGSWQKFLLPDAPMRWLFGRVSRLQIVVLAVILAYLLIFSLIGIVYKTWVTPIKDSSLSNTRTGLGGWADRVGVLAYALTPLAVLLCMRESILSILTGIPYQYFNFLHRWLGRVIFIQSALHTIGWTIVEAKLYQPQPSVYVTFIQQQYMVFGCVAMLFISFLTVFSFKPVIRWTGYEFFKVTHWIVAVLYIGACWGHWDKLYCWMVPSLALIVIDQCVRYGRMAYLHSTGGKGRSSGFKCDQARMQVLTDDNGTVIRLDFEHEHATSWKAGQHFYLTFPSLSIWQAHPYTVSSVPDPNASTQTHTYLIRVRNGQSKQMVALGDCAIPVIIAGPYGHGFPSYESRHVLAVAGGTGVTFTYPIIMEFIRQSMSRRAVQDFVWVVRKSEDLLWLGTELREMKGLLKDMLGLTITIFVSRESRVGKGGEESESSLRHESDQERSVISEKGKETAAVDTTAVEVSLSDLLAPAGSRFKVHFLQDHHPSVAEVVTDFRERSANIGGPVEIVGSGPEAMGTDIRFAVSKIDEGDGVSLYWDSRE